MDSDAHEASLRLSEDHLRRLSVLHELTVTALALFDAERPLEQFLERLAERLGCAAALWIGCDPGRPPALLGAVGLAPPSRALALPPDWTDADPLPYPELASPDLVRWTFVVEPAPSPSPDRGVLVLLLPRARAPAEYHGMVARLVGILRTILLHRRLAAELRRSYDALQRAQQELVARERLVALGELSAVIAHEVRNPLAVIVNTLGSLRRVASRDPLGAQLVDIVTEETGRLNRIVSDLLDFARPHRVVLAREELGQMVASAVAEAQTAAASEKPVTIETQLESPLPTAAIDVRLLHQALVNVIVNAIQSMPRGGRVVVRVRSGGADDPLPVRLEVSDQGEGMAPDVAARVFEPFFTTKARGTGLGLVVVRRVVEAHHGEVSVSSEPGRGTTITIRLPATTRAA